MRLRPESWPRTAGSVLDRYLAALPADLPWTRRQMFGCPCVFLQGLMSSGVFGGQVFLRLPEAQRARLLAQPGARPFEPQPGRIMREYVCLPPALIEDADALAGWLRESLAYVQSLPPRPQPPRRGSRSPLL